MTTASQPVWCALTEREREERLQSHPMSLVRRPPTRNAGLANIDADTAQTIAEAWAKRPNATRGAQDFYAEALTRWLKASMSPHTRASYSRTVRAAFEFFNRRRKALVAPHEVRESDVDAWVEHLLSGSRVVSPGMMANPLERAVASVVEAKSPARVSFATIVNALRDDPEAKAIVEDEETMHKLLSRMVRRHYLDREPHGEEARGALIGEFTYSTLPKGPVPAPATIVQRLSALASFFRAMRGKDGRLPGLPYDSPVGASPVEDVLSKWVQKAKGEADERRYARQTKAEDLQLLEAAIRRTPDVSDLTRARDWALVQMLFQAGLRVSELMGAQNRDLVIDGQREDGSANYVLTVRRKRGKVQGLAIEPEAYMALASMRNVISASDLPDTTRKAATLPEAPLVPAVGRRGVILEAAKERARTEGLNPEYQVLVPMTEAGVRMVFAKYIDAIAGDDAEVRAHLAARLHPHGLRHLYASVWVNMVPLHELQQRLGHSSTATTDKYLPKVDTRHLKETGLLRDYLNRTSPDAAAAAATPMRSRKRGPQAAAPAPSTEATTAPSAEASLEHEGAPRAVAPAAVVDRPAHPSGPPLARTPREEERTVTVELPPKGIIAMTSGAAEGEDNPTFPTAPTFAYRSEPLVTGKQPAASGAMDARNGIEGKGRGVYFGRGSFMTGNMTLLPYRYVPGANITARLRVPLPCLDESVTGDGLRDLQEQTAQMYDAVARTSQSRAQSLMLWVVTLLSLGQKLDDAIRESRMHWIAFDEEVPLRERGKSEDAYWREVVATTVRAHETDGIVAWLKANSAQFSGALDASADRYGMAFKEAGMALDAGCVADSKWVALEHYAPPEWMLMTDDPIGDPRYGIMTTDRDAFVEWASGILVQKAVVYDERSDSTLPKHVADVLRTLQAYWGPANEALRVWNEQGMAAFKRTDWARDETQRAVKAVCAGLRNPRLNPQTFDPTKMATSKWRAAVFRYAGVAEPAPDNTLSARLFDSDDGAAAQVFSTLYWDAERNTYSTAQGFREAFIRKYGLDPQLVARRALRGAWERRQYLIAAGKQDSAPSGKRAESVLNVQLAFVIPAPAELEAFITETASKAKPRFEEMQPAFDRARAYMLVRRASEGPIREPDPAFVEALKSFEQGQVLPAKARKDMNPNRGVQPSMPGWTTARSVVSAAVPMAFALLG